MRRRRLKAGKIRKRYNYFLIILFVIIIPLSAILIGSRITERIMMPVLYSGVLDEEELSDITNEDFHITEINELSNKDNESYSDDISATGEMLNESLSPLSAYVIQIASVSDAENAETFIEELNARKLPHIIYKMGNAYKVYTLGSTNRSLIEEELLDIREFYPDAYISEVHLLSKELSYPKSKEKVCGEIINGINSLIKIMDKQSKEWYNFVKKEGKLDDYVEVLIEEKELVKKLSMCIKNNDLPDNFLEKETIEKMLVHKENNIKLSLELLEDKENLHKVHSLFLDGLFRTLEIIK